MNIVELATFQLKENVDVNDFLKLSTQFQNEFVAKQAGFISRKLIRKEHTWCDLVIWESMDHATKVSENMGNNPASKSYGSNIKPGTIKVEHYEIYQ